MEMNMSFLIFSTILFICLFFFSVEREKTLAIFSLVATDWNKLERLFLCTYVLSTLLQLVCRHEIYTISLFIEQISWEAAISFD